MPDGAALALALLILAATLAAAVVRSSLVPEAVVAAAGAAVLVVLGVVSPDHAADALRELGPTIGLLAALLLIADGCRRDGLFEALGTAMARGARGAPRRLLAFVFATATAVTAALGLDATVVLLTPVVFATAARMRTSPRPHVYACAHLANSASLLLPVSNLTNLLRFHASGLSFARFGLLMALLTLGAVAVEWLVFRRFFAVDLERPRHRSGAPGPQPLPRFALVVVAATLGGFALSSALAIDPLWIAAAGAAAITAPGLIRRTAGLGRVVRAAEPGFLVFVAGLGVIVQAASDHGLAAAVRHVVPGGEALPDLLAIAAVSAVLANLVNNLPATLVLLPVTAAAGPPAVLAMLIGVNIGPNLTYVGSLATLPWRRVLHAEDTDVGLWEFLRLGVATVPAALVTSTVLLWFALQGVG